MQQVRKPYLPDIGSSAATARSSELQLAISKVFLAAESGRGAAISRGRGAVVARIAEVIIAVAVRRLHLSAGTHLRG